MWIPINKNKINTNINKYKIKLNLKKMKSRISSIFEKRTPNLSIKC